ncbi:hypothetical protein CC2G_011428 [Coprinopsis cinerea AmutBmut pab1-1]|nr:hypothetical protein CC2G_011428 [Coprinopsis cinerea AmutBmut pab1-1]
MILVGGASSPKFYDRACQLTDVSQCGCSVSAKAGIRGVYITTFQRFPNVECRASLVRTRQRHNDRLSPNREGPQFLLWVEGTSAGDFVLWRFSDAIKRSAASK